MYEIKAFETKNLREFNQKNGRTSQHHVMLLQRGRTYTLAVFDLQLQVLGFPQVLIGEGYCSPLGELKKEIQNALVGFEALEKAGHSCSSLLKSAWTGSGNPNAYRPKAQAVEIFWFTCVQVGSGGDLSAESAPAFFVSEWNRYWVAP